MQATNRFHLLKNLSEALERLLTRKHRLVAQAARGVIVEAPPPVTPPVQEPSLPTAASTRAERERDERRAQRRARYTEATELRQCGAKLREVAAAAWVSTRTLRRWALAGSYLERADYKRPSILAPYLPYLASRWGEGCRNALGLWRELRGRGFRGLKEIVRYHLSRWRAELPAHLRYSRGASGPKPLAPPSPRRAAWMLLKGARKRRLSSAPSPMRCASCVRKSEPRLS